MSERKLLKFKSRSHCEERSDEVEDAPWRAIPLFLVDCFGKKRLAMTAKFQIM